MLPHRVRHLQVFLCHIGSQLGDLAILLLGLLGQAHRKLLHSGDLVFDLVISGGCLGMLLLHCAQLLIDAY